MSVRDCLTAGGQILPPNFLHFVFLLANFPHLKNLWTRAVGLKQAERMYAVISGSQEHPYKNPHCCFGANKYRPRFHFNTHHFSSKHVRFFHKYQFSVLFRIKTKNIFLLGILRNFAFKYFPPPAFFVFFLASDKKHTQITPLGQCGGGAP